jgi:hypothetical protein
MRVFTSAACLSAALLASHGAAAQNPSSIETHLGIDLLTSRIQDVAAEQEGTGTRAWGGQAIGSVTAYRVLTLTGELGVVDMVDERPFQQGTTNGDMTSSVSAFVGTLAAGLRTPPVALEKESSIRLVAGVNAGHTWLRARRLITNCSDCHAEDVELRAGDFLEPALYVTRGRGGLNARYRMYRDGSNWENAVVIGYTWRLGPKAAAPEDVPEEEAEPQ